MAATTNRSAPARIGGDTDWLAVAAGYDNSLAVKSDGSLWAWGANSSGQLGDGTTSPSLVPKRIGAGRSWIAVSCSGSISTSPSVSHSLGLKADGSLWAWGSNKYGRLGDGTAVDRWAPVRVGSSTDWALISAGNHQSLAIKRDGSLWAWGWNGNGQLGDGTAISRLVPTRIGNDNHWVAVSTGQASTFAVKSDGSLWAWGATTVAVSSATAR